MIERRDTRYLDAILDELKTERDRLKSWFKVGLISEEDYSDALDQVILKLKNRLMKKRTSLSDFEDV